MDNSPFVLSSHGHSDGPDPAEEQHLQFLQRQLAAPSPIQPPHHDQLSTARNPPSVSGTSVIQIASSSSNFNDKTPTTTASATTNSTTTSSSSSSNVLSNSMFNPATPMTPMTPITPSSADLGIMPQLQNIVSTVNLGCKLDLKKIALHARNAEYNPKRFAAVIMRIREPRTTALIFSSGKMVCTGAKSEEQSRLAARKYARIVQKLGFNVCLNGILLFNLSNLLFY